MEVSDSHHDNLNAPLNPVAVESSSSSGSGPGDDARFDIYKKWLDEAAAEVRMTSQRRQVEQSKCCGCCVIS
jgi:hypothetical protein